MALRKTLRSLLLPSEELFKVGLCLPSGSMVTDEDLANIVKTIKNAKK